VIDLFDMKVVVTGSSGFVGKTLLKVLQANNVDIIEYDIVHGEDLFDLKNLIEKSRNADSIVHLAYINGNDQSTYDQNIEMTSNIVKAITVNKLRKLVYLSSVDSLGLFKGEGTPDYLPIDEDHPTRPKSFYGKHKLASESLLSELCRNYDTNVCVLRTPAIWDDATFEFIENKRKTSPEYEYIPYWEYGAFIEVNDLANLVNLILHDSSAHSYELYHTAANDISTSGMDRYQLAAKLLPNTSWKIKKTKENAFKCILSNDRVKNRYGWNPLHNWENRSARLIPAKRSIT
jgi:UDP-glucose 4-epimerase